MHYIGIQNSLCSLRTQNKYSSWILGWLHLCFSFFLSFFYLFIYFLTKRNVFSPSSGNHEAKIKVSQTAGPFWKVWGKHSPYSSLIFCWLPWSLVFFGLSLPPFSRCLSICISGSQLSLSCSACWGSAVPATGTGALAATVPEGPLGTNPPGGRHYLYPQTPFLKETIISGPIWKENRRQAPPLSQHFRCLFPKCNTWCCELMSTWKWRLVPTPAWHEGHPPLMVIKRKQRPV